MKTSRDELLRETLVRYYWRLVCNGAKALADALVEFRCNNFENASVKSSCPDI